ncbi:MAG: efflux RND transporter periplasmic adaptor subunit [Hyphomicrobiaceae bacterium]|nr:efflux RND transporter periplasmic adaptor subunit [Hyphomicrobiaceae bacterium]
MGTIVIFPANAEASFIDLTPEQIDRLEINIADIDIAKTESVALLPGKVVPSRTGRLIVSAPFAGTVQSIMVLPGQFVKKGTPLATISSRDLIKSTARLKRAQAELVLAKVKFRKQMWLVTKKIHSKVMADIARAEMGVQRVIVKEYQDMLAIDSIIRHNNGTYTLRAPKSGRIAAATIMLGEQVAAMGAAVTIDTVKDLWIEAQLPASLISSVKIGDEVQVVGAPPGKVIAVGGVIDPMTRSATLLARLPARSDLLAGQMITVTLKRKTAPGGLKVPSSALTYIDGAPVVFVKNNKGFKLVKIMVRGQSMDEVTVAGNLSSSQKVATTGLAYLEKMIDK